MKPRHILTTLMMTFIFGSYTSLACMWDYDTLAMEARTFPDALDLITGKFLRHSTEYYQWRVEDRKAKLEKDPNNLAYYDDLAVAYDKLNQSDKAIELMLKKDAIKPGLYETEANLGTFYIHSGQLEKGLVHIKKAIEINPDAHFGREVYQMRLVEYVLSKRIDGKLVLPLDTTRNAGGIMIISSTGDAQNKAKNVKRTELMKAHKGILGMMRFGNYKSPILLEVLGDILLKKGDAKRLACRAYLKASYEAKDETAQKAYREKASKALSMQTKHPGTTDTLTLAEVERTFKKELENAAAWYAKIAANEKAWKAKGLNLDDKFTATYYKPVKKLRKQK